MEGDVTVGLNRRLNNQANTLAAAVQAKKTMANLLSIELGNEPECGLSLSLSLHNQCLPDWRPSSLCSRIANHPIDWMESRGRWCQSKILVYRTRPISEPNYI